MLSEPNVIEEFIHRRFASTNANWTNGNCYWFAKILTDRFEGLEIYYIPSEGHFVAGDGENFFDYNGLIKGTYRYIPFKEIKEDDPLWYSRLIKDCVL
jgi:hypothetical protein